MLLNAAVNLSFIPFALEIEVINVLQAPLLEMGVGRVSALFDGQSSDGCHSSLPSASQQLLSNSCHAVGTVHSAIPG